MSPSVRPTGALRAPAMPSEERRASIIEAIRPLLAEHGDRLTSRQIAEAAGIAELADAVERGESPALEDGVVEGARGHPSTLASAPLAASRPGVRVLEL